MSADTEELLVNTALQVSDKQKYYEASVDIYGHFSELKEKIQRLVKKRI